MKILITGADGMLGQAFLREARSRGYELVAATRRGSGIHCDVADDPALEELIESVRPDIVVNCAAIVSFARCEEDPWSAWRVNARAVGVLGECCQRAGARLIHISTDHYYTGDHDRLHDETDPITLLNEYARTKFAGEAFALNFENALVLRTNLIGLRGGPSPTFAEWAMDLAEQDQAATLFDDSFVSSIDAASFAARAFDLVAQSGVGLYNLAASEVFSKKQLIEEIARQMGRTLTRTITGSIRSLSVPRAESCGLNVTKAEKILGPLPTLEQVVARLLEQRIQQP